MKLQGEGFSQGEDILGDNAKKTETILVIDDDPAVQKMIKMVLEMANYLKKGNYNVLTADNGSEGLKVYEEHFRSIALVLLDLGLPDIKGPEVLKNLLKINGKVNVIITTGDSIQGELSGDLKGAKGYINKPYADLEKVYSVVRSAIDSDVTKN